MKKCVLLGMLILANTFVHGQNVIDWDGIYKLQLSDFQSKSSQIGGVNIWSLSTAASIDFSYQMSGYEFMFTKNFNSKVISIFKRDQSLLIAPDQESALSLLGYAQYDFDLSELYARKFRKKLFEKKGAFTDARFFQPIYDEINKEFVERLSTTGKDTNIGGDKLKLRILHEQVLNEIEVLAEFCKTCKPAKKKKQPAN